MKISGSLNKNSNDQKKSEKQSLLSIFEINVIRYALYIDDIKPEDIDPFFLIDFMSLPENYYSTDAYEKYEKFLFRYGTHYIYSAQFGGQIMFENSRAADIDTDMNDLAEQSAREFQNSFGAAVNVEGTVSIPIEFLTADIGGGLKAMATIDLAQKNRNENFLRTTHTYYEMIFVIFAEIFINMFYLIWLSKQKNWTSVLLQSQGGDINVAKLITRLESNTGSTLIEWLRSIPKYPKAFKIKMRPINELLDINVRSLFIGELNPNQTCQITSSRKCVFGSTIQEFQQSFNKRRKSLEIAIEIFRHKVLIVLSHTAIVVL